MSSTEPTPQRKRDSSVAEWYEEQVEVPNPQGFHARPAGLVAETAGRFGSAVVIRRDDADVNAKSTIHLLTLVAEQGSRLTVRATGEDAQEAVRAVVAVIRDGFGEM